MKFPRPPWTAAAGPPRSGEEHTRNHSPPPPLFRLFFLNDTAPTEIYTLPLPDALPIWLKVCARGLKSSSQGSRCPKRSAGPLRLFGWTSLSQSGGYGGTAPANEFAAPGVNSASGPA